MASETCINVVAEGCSSVWIKIDGQEVISPSAFSHHNHQIAVKVFLDAGDHDLSVRLASKPGTTISVELLAGCSLDVDESIEPVVDTLDDFYSDEPAPVAALADEYDRTTSFVANELIIQNDDPEVVSRIVNQYSGTIILTLDADDVSDFHLPPTYVVRLNVDSADTTMVADDIGYMAGLNGVPAMGRWRVSSMQGLRLLAIAAAESRLSGGIDLDFIGSMNSIPGSTREAPMGLLPNQWEDAYDPVRWINFSRCERGPSIPCLTVDTGVAEAWSLLYLTGRLDQGNQYPFVSNPLKIAILDGGFTCVDPDDPNAPYPDYPDYEGWAVLAPISLPEPCEKQTWNPCGGTCPWHGTEVAGAAVGVPDNMWGGAGTGGPVSTPIFYFTSAEKTLALYAIEDAVHNTDAKIVNMSWSYEVPAIVGWLNHSFEVHTAWANRHGLLLFAAAGNRGNYSFPNVDDEDCFLGICWEPWWNAPCENDGVLCVGGMESSYSQGQSIRNPDSSYGRENVDLWAPFTGLVGPTPDSPDPKNRAHYFSGTSYSSPFAAGVAALVWQSQPTLTNDEVEEILFSTSNQFFDDSAGTMRGVNAYDAVLKAIGFQPLPAIVTPEDGQVFELNQPIRSFQANLDMIIDYSPVPICIDVIEQWSSSIDGALGPPAYYSLCGHDYDGLNQTQSFLWDPVLSEGEHVISYYVLAMDSEGRTYVSNNSGLDEVRITVANSPPYDITISEPDAGDVFCAGQEVRLTGDASDHNQDLPDYAFTWLARYDDNTYPIATGRDTTTTDLAAGLDAIVLHVCDDHGACVTNEVGITVLLQSDPECSNLPPSASIVAPTDGQQFEFLSLDPVSGYYALVELIGDATDDQDPTSSLTFDWSSDIDGILGQGQDIGVHLHVPDGCSQWHQVTLVVTDSGGKQSEPVAINVLIIGPECVGYVP